MFIMSKKALQLACLTGALCIALCGCSLNITGGGESSGEASKKNSTSENSKKSSDNDKEESSKDEESSGAEESSEAESSTAPKDEKPTQESANAAYAKVVEKLLEDCGKPKVQNSFLNGVAVVRLIDFDGDGIKELLCVYPQENDMFANKQEVYGYADGEAVSLFKDRVQNWGTSVDPFVEYIEGEKGAYILTDYRSTMSESKGTWVTFKNNQQTTGMSFYTNAPSFDSGEGQGAELIYKIDDKKLEKEEFDKAMDEFNKSGEEKRLMISVTDDSTVLEETEATLKTLGVSI